MLKKIYDSLNGTKVFEIVEDDGSKFEIDLAKLYSSVDAIDITSLGSRWQNICDENASMLTIEESYMHGGELNCEEKYYDMYSTHPRIENPGADLMPTVLPTVDNSKIDDIIKSITSPNPLIGKKEGSAMMNLLFEDLSSKLRFYAFETVWKNEKGDELDARGYRENGNNAWVDKDIIHIDAYKSEDKRSRAQAHKTFATPKEEVKARVMLSDVSSDAKGSGRGAMTVMLNNINSSNENIFAKVELRNNKIVYYIEKHDSNGENIVEIKPTTKIEDVSLPSTNYHFDLSIKTEQGKIKINVVKIDAMTGNSLEVSEVTENIDTSYDLAIDEVKLRAEVREDAESYENIDSATKLRVFSFNALSTPSIDNTFGGESLKGKTFYFVWYGEGQDSNGNDIQNVPVVEKVEIENTGNTTITGILNADNDTGVVTFADDKMYFGMNSSSIDFNEFTKYISGSLSTGCIKTQWVNLNNLNDGNTDLMFTDQTKAVNFANTLTAPATDCPSN